MTRTILTMLFVITSVSGIAQDLILGALGEYTVSGPEVGAVVMYESRKAMGIGVFYQQGTSEKEQGFQSTFYGALIQVPLVNAERILFSGILRGGMINREFFFVTPSLETKLNVRKKWALVFGMGVRKGYPSLSGKIVHKLF